MNRRGACMTNGSSSAFAISFLWGRRAPFLSAPDWTAQASPPFFPVRGSTLWAPEGPAGAAR
eukprot:2564894-Lingulodinium_polyedra.AAC.1